MELRQLEYFLELSRARNFTKASEHLNVAQPAVSKAVQKLEEELGVLLVKRDQKPLGLTEEGERFAVRVESILKQLEEAAWEARSGSGNRRALSVGITPMGGVLVGEMLTRPEAIVDGMLFNLIYCGPLETVGKLLRREMDLGVILKNNVPPELEYIPLETQEALCMLPKDSPLLEREILRFEDLKEERFCMDTDPGKSVLGSLVRARCMEAGFTPPAPGLVGDYHPNAQLIAGWVCKGYGVTFMPEHSARRAQGIALRSMTPPLQVELGLAYRKTEKPSPQLRRLIRYICENYPGYPAAADRN